MNCYKSPSHDAAWNLALEDWLFHHTEGDFLLLWCNEPCIIIGQNQYAAREVDLEKAKSLNVPVIRRSTGGGAVYQDLGNLNLSFMTEDSFDDENLFSRFLTPLLLALNACDIKGEFNGRNDICVDGKKISGSAAKVENGRLLHHCTLLVDCNLERMNALLTPDKEKLARNGVKSVKSRVTNLKKLAPSFDLDQLMNTLWDETYALPPEAEQEICAIAAQKYGNDAWNLKLLD